MLYYATLPTSLHTFDFRMAKYLCLLAAAMGKCVDAFSVRLDNLDPVTWGGLLCIWLSEAPSSVFKHGTLPLAPVPCSAHVHLVLWPLQCHHYRHHRGQSVVGVSMASPSVFGVPEPVLTASSSPLPATPSANPALHFHTLPTSCAQSILIFKVVWWQDRQTTTPAATKTTAPGTSPWRTTFWLQVNCESDIVVAVAVAICVIFCQCVARVNVFA